MAVSKLFDISRRSLLTYQRALTVTSNNVANADNANYTRQRSMFSSVSPDSRGKISFGSGVSLDDIQRVRNDIFDIQVWENIEKRSFSERQAEILANIEALYSEPTEMGLSSLMNDFFNSWDELSVDPTSSALRNSVIYSAQKMGAKIQSVYEGLTQMNGFIQKDLELQVDELNNYTSELKEVNAQIYEAHVAGYGHNDLLDKRDEIIKQISEMVNANVSFDEYGTANVSIGGVFAVDRVHQTEFKVSQEANGNLSIRSVDGNAKLTLKSGALYANIRTSNELIPQYTEEIDTIASTIMDSINAVHNTGYTLTDPQTTGINFFSHYGDGILRINEDILNDSKNIAISADGTDGNNEIALQIAKIRDEKLINGFSILDSYGSHVSGIASEKQFQDQNAETYGLVVSQLEQQVSNYSGVSIDEEMTDVLKFQRSYDASAKLINIADEMLQTLLNI